MTRITEAYAREHNLRLRIIELEHELACEKATVEWLKRELARKTP